MTVAPTLMEQLGARSRRPSLTIWACVATICLFLLWSSMAWVDEIVRANGEFIASSRPQIIQNLEGGILSELLVQQGDTVAQGEVVARLHGMQFKSSVEDLRDQITAFEIRRRRLEAELDGQYNFTTPEDLARRSPKILASERTLLKARQTDFAKRSDGARKVRDQAAKELALLENLLEKKVVALIEVTRARKEYADAERRYDEIVTQTELERAQEYSETLKKLATLRQNLNASQDQLDRTVLTSPMRGIVNNLNITTIGGVVQPGQQIMEIIPIDDDLLVQARVAPEDIANLRRGQEATIKLTAYDYTIYGTLNGTIDFISADTFKDKQTRNAVTNSYYKVMLSVDTTRMTPRQSHIAIRPGMQVQVELHTGEKTILQYLLKPLYKSQEALREP